LNGDEAVTDKYNIESLSVKRKYYKSKFSLKQFSRSHGMYQTELLHNV